MTVGMRARVLRWRRGWRPNPPLLIGGAIVGTLLLAAVFAPLLAPFDPLEAVLLYREGTLLTPPFPPGTARFLLGSDTLGRDMYSRLLYGARLTLIFAGVTACVRLLFGAALGLLAGWFRPASWVVDVFSASLSAIPTLLFGLVLVAIVPTNGNVPLVLLLAALLGLSGWGEIAARCRVAVRELRARPFVEAAQTVGRSQMAILLRHILPNLRGLLATEAAYAVAASLLLIAELGFLGAYVAGATVEQIGSRLIVDPTHPEWSGMIAAGARWNESAPWVVWEPMLLLALAILGFYLLAEGLRRTR